MATEMLNGTHKRLFMGKANVTALVKKNLPACVAGDKVDWDELERLVKADISEYPPRQRPNLEGLRGRLYQAVGAYRKGLGGLPGQDLAGMRSESHAAEARALDLTRRVLVVGTAERQPSPTPAFTAEQLKAAQKALAEFPGTVEDFVAAAQLVAELQASGAK